MRADVSGNLWISSNTGIYRVSRDGLNRMVDGGAAAEVMIAVLAVVVAAVVKLKRVPGASAAAEGGRTTQE